MEVKNSNTSRAEELKVLANEAFKAHKYAQAIDLYTQAIELNDQSAVYWANRAFAHTKLEEYGSAIQDASKAIEIDPKYSKDYYQWGAAYLAMGKFKEALKDFQQMNNKGAFIRFEAPAFKPNVVTFSAVPHPDVKPMAYANNFLRLFQYPVMLRFIANPLFMILLYGPFA